MGRRGTRRDKKINQPIQTVTKLKNVEFEKENSPPEKKNEKKNDEKKIIKQRRK